MTDNFDSEDLDNTFEDIGFRPLGRPVRATDSDEKKENIESRRRLWRTEGAHTDDVLSLTSGHDGVLRWHVSETGYRAGSRRAGRDHRASLPAGKIEKQYAFEKLTGSNQVSKLVSAIDDKCTNPDKRGLWKLNDSLDYDIKFSDIRSEGDLTNKKILLFIHGTFSHGDTTAQQIKTAESRTHGKFGHDFVKKASEKYDLVLSFNHPTLAVSPMVNAFNLASELRDPNGPPKSIDIICHSRGGVVTRWWLEGFASQDSDYRVVFLGAPLGGTSLASPTNLKSGMNLISNYAQVTGKGLAMTANPILMAAGSVFATIGSIAKIGAKAPVLDAACAIFPGLMGQARTNTNYEIKNLRTAGSFQAHRENYYAVISNFEPSDLEKWKFWNVFCKPKSYAMDLAEGVIDKLIFTRLDENKKRVPIANDMVVDCESMTDLADGASIPQDNIYDFKNSSKVHHTNYVVQFHTLNFIREVFNF
ncbi:MAG: hypothetical protein ABJO36_07655 [Litorimonas sp.]